jgi:hypothetical protein
MSSVVRDECMAVHAFIYRSVQCKVYSSYIYVERSHVKGQKSQAQGTRSSKLRAADLENACTIASI